MTFWIATILGAVQGLTEFLPISSTAHLRIVGEALLGHSPGTAFIAVVQLGTIAAVLVYFRGDLWRIVTAFFRGLRDAAVRRSTEFRLALAIGFGTRDELASWLRFVAPTIESSVGNEVLTTAIGWSVGLAGVVLVWWAYARPERLAAIKRPLAGGAVVAQNLFYWDAAYRWIAYVPASFTATAFAVKPTSREATAI